MGFLELLEEKRILIADGAMGTLLQAAGLPAGMAPEEWNILEPAEIEAMHRAYLEAGAQIVLTNTFGATRVKLRRMKKADEMERLNRAAVDIARRAAAPFGALVAGDMGPTGELLEPLGALSMGEARAAYAEQAGVLADAGVDLFVVETMSDLNETRAAVEGVMEASTLPVVVSMSFDTHGRTMMGVRPADFMAAIWPMGVAAIGANCGKSLEDNLLALRQLREANPDAILWVKPNAGLPHLEDSATVYDVSPEQFAAYGPKYAELGARVLGGCCGSTPAHIAALSRRMREFSTH